MSYCYNDSVILIYVMFVYIMLSKSFHNSHLINMEVTSVVGVPAESPEIPQILAYGQLLKYCIAENPGSNYIWCI